MFQHAENKTVHFILLHCIALQFFGGLFYCTAFHFTAIFTFRRLNWLEVKQKKWLLWLTQRPDAVWP